MFQFPGGESPIETRALCHRADHFAEDLGDAYGSQPAGAVDKVCHARAQSDHDRGALTR